MGVKEDKNELRREQKEVVDRLEREQKEAVDKLRREQKEAVDKIGREQEEAAGKLGRGQKEAVDKLGREQEEAAGKLGRGQKEAVDKLGREQEEAAGKLGRGQKEAVDRLVLKHIKLHDEFKGEIKGSVEHLKKHHEITEDTLKTRHVETRETLKKTDDSNTLKSRNSETEEQIVSQHEEAENTLQRDYQTSIDRLDTEENEALSRHKQTQVDINEKQRWEQKEAVDRLGRGQEEAAGKLGREQKEAVDRLGREQKEAVDKLRQGQEEAAGKLGRGQDEAREKLFSTQLKTENNLERLQDTELHTTVKKRIVILTVIPAVLILVTVALALQTSIMNNLEPSVEKYANLELKTQHIINNLRGDTVDIWATWRLPQDRQFHINVKNSPHLTDERRAAIYDVIMSTRTIDIEDIALHKGPPGIYSTYYEGWRGALNSINTDTKFTIPKDLYFQVTDDIDGDIVIILTDLTNPDGYSGYTSSIADEANHQILKSTITIYDVDELSMDELKILVRHELGHGFGLGHSTAPEDLMAPTIATIAPYISGCNIDAVVELYDDKGSSQVVCEK